MLPNRKNKETRMPIIMLGINQFISDDKGYHNLLQGPNLFFYF